MTNYFRTNLNCVEDNFGQQDEDEIDGIEILQQQQLFKEKDQICIKILVCLL